jgi:two-component system response regulator AtoC
MKILIVDDEPVALKSVERLLRRRGIRNCHVCDNGAQAIGLIERNYYDVVLLDIIMPEVDGMQVLEAVAPGHPGTEFIVLTAVDETDHAVRAIKLGAYDYLVKPVDNDRLIHTIERAYERKGMRVGLGVTRECCSDVSVPECFKKFITQSLRMKELLSYAEVMAGSDVPILIYGESGTGKELIAEGIHRASRYAEGPFVPVNMASIPEPLFESHFFGHAKGTFTGADRSHRGYFEQADGGTLFLDEVGELPLHLQPKLLRVLENKTITRLGDDTPVHVDVRIVSATNKDLDRACRENAFRSDLLFRIKSAFIAVPPLGERASDIPLLTDYVVRRSAEEMGKEDMRVSAEALRLLSSRRYPGNVRELFHIVNNAVITAEGTEITPRHLVMEHHDVDPLTRTLCSLGENENAHVVYVLVQTGGDRKEAARVLGVSIRQVQRKVATLRNNPKWRRYLGDM